MCGKGARNRTGLNMEQAIVLIYFNALNYGNNSGAPILRLPPQST